MKFYFALIHLSNNFDWLSSWYLRGWNTTHLFSTISRGYRILPMCFRPFLGVIYNPLYNPIYNDRLRADLMDKNALCLPFWQHPKLWKGMEPTWRCWWTTVSTSKAGIVKKRYPPTLEEREMIQKPGVLLWVAKVTWQEMHHHIVVDTQWILR